MERKHTLSSTSVLLPHVLCVCVCLLVVGVQLVGTFGAIMTAPTHLCLSIAPGYQCALVRHVAS